MNACSRILHYCLRLCQNIVRLQNSNATHNGETGLLQKEKRKEGENRGGDVSRGQAMEYIGSTAVAASTISQDLQGVSLPPDEPCATGAKLNSLPVGAITLEVTHGRRVQGRINFLSKAKSANHKRI